MVESTIIEKVFRNINREEINTGIKRPSFCPLCVNRGKSQNERSVYSAWMDLVDYKSSYYDGDLLLFRQYRAGERW